MLSKKLLESINNLNQSGVVTPEGVSFDGSTDYLIRSSDLVGNVDSKTFTFSAWVYASTTSGNILEFGITNEFYIYLSSDKLIIRAGNTSGTSILYTYTTIKANSFNHILISFDLSNTSNRYIFINDTDVTSNTTWNTYIDDFINFTFTTIGRVGMNLKGRLNDYFLDYTYRDLSIEANRRLFITADGKPADGLESLNPILYLPMKDASTAHINLGTGGDFVQNGTLATADRGANQDNCVASKFDGVDDYLSSTGIGASDSKQVTFSCTLKEDLASTGTDYVLWLGDSTALFFTIRKDSDYFRVNGRLTDYNDSINITIPYQYNLVGFSRVLTLSFDLTDINSLKCFINGSSVTPSVSTYVDQNIKMTYSNNAIGNSTASTSYKYLGSIGELYFDTNYIDLSTNNPFWDSETNKPIPVRTAMANLGSNPLICMPIDASNPTKNYGSGGDFTLNGGGLVGARGMSEYISRSAKFDSGENLTNTSINGTFVNKTFIYACMKYDTSTGDFEVRDVSGSTYGGLKIGVNSLSITYTVTRTNGGASGWSYNTTTTDWNIVVLEVDWTTTTNNVKLYVNGSNVATQSYDTLGTPSGTTYRGVVQNGSLFSQCYFSNEYIDFSQESNRNLFVNQLGYPRDLTPEIEAGNIPTPLIYLPFDDTSNLGKNLGTGGDFTVNGTVTQGADFAL